MNDIGNSFRGVGNTIIDYIPNVLGALLLLLVAWIVATVVRAIFTKGLKKAGADRAMVKGHMAKTKEDADSILDSIGKILYYLIFILFIPSVLQALDMNNVAQPISNMMDKLLAFLPNLFMAIIILVIGYFVAKFVKNLVFSLLTAINIDKWFNKFTNKPSGTTGTTRMDAGDKATLANVLANIVFVIVLIPILTIALETLNIQSISEPIVNMLNQVLNMIPNIFVAIILILVGVLIAKFVGDLLISLLNGTGINRFSTYLNTDKTKTPSFDIANIIGKVVQAIIIIFFTVEAMNVLQLDVLNGIGEAVIAYLPLLISSLIILGLGLIGGSLLGNYVKQASGNRFMGAVVKYIIIIIAVFMTLDQLNFATNIVNLAFLFIIAGLAVAFAISFGMGGREFAKRQLEKFEAKMEKENDKPDL
ncbi:putative integral inner membrane protein [Planococcus donghaensis MPA1U2]|uniref:Putative integral inner membrane protein n=1 Tax=Planococcus donghaensis MPA1U2 TaxID=933115 RepID=E7RGF6_9BACL|nr:mechanosensitive ion channel [Planococcus donghaensis]EGA89931.1 putative integral inner membrane protein [Planococcus donghaensis MPA1U2]